MKRIFVCLALALLGASQIQAKKVLPKHEFFQASIQGQLLLKQDGSVDAVTLKTESPQNLQTLMLGILHKWQLDYVAPEGQAFPVEINFHLISRARFDDAGELESVELVRPTFFAATSPENTDPMSFVITITPPEYPVFGLVRDMGAELLLVVSIDDRGLAKEVWIEDVLITSPGASALSERLFLKEAIKSVRAATKKWRFDPNSVHRSVRVPVTFIPPTQVNRSWIGFTRTDIPEGEARVEPSILADVMESHNGQLGSSNIKLRETTQTN